MFKWYANMVSHSLILYNDKKSVSDMKTLSIFDNQWLRWTRWKKVAWQKVTNFGSVTLSIFEKTAVLFSHCHFVHIFRISD